MAEEKRVETRKIQRLGTSSLVVTLPKAWVNRVNLKPGDTVYVVVEGDSVRIIPGSLPKPEPGKLVLELRVDEAKSLAPHIVGCLYVMGHREVYIKLEEADLQVINRILESTSRLLGAEASCQGDNTIRFNVVLDSEKIDITSYILSMVRNLSLLIQAIKNTSRESPKTDISSVKMLFNEVTRTQHFIIRYLLLYLRSSRTPISLSAPPQSILIASTLLGQAGLIAYRASERLSRDPDRERILDWITSLADEATKIVDSLADLVKRPEAAKSIDLLRAVEELKEKTVKKLYSPLQAYIASKLEDFLDIMRIVALVLLCTAIESRLVEQPVAP